MAKRKGNLWEPLVSDENLTKAIDEVNRTHHWRAGHRPNKITLWVEKTKSERVKELRRILEDGFVPKPPRVMTRWDASARKERVINEPAQYPDQYIHHALIQVLEPVMMRGMDKYCCGSIRRRGTSYEKEAMERWVRKDEKGTKYELYCDIRHFYGNLTPDVCLARMRQLIKDRRVLGLIESVISNGVQIGAYTSQWFANTVLQPLDMMIRQSGLCKHYARYMDNMTIFGSNRRKLWRLKKQIDVWLAAHGLQLKGDWQMFLVAGREKREKLTAPRNGVTRQKRRLPYAVGYRYGREYTLPSKYKVYSIKRAMAAFWEHGRVSADAARGLLSRLGQLQCCNNCNLYRMLFRGSRVARKLKSIVKERRRKEARTWNIYLGLSPHAA